jgi:hypothetical protein
VVGHHQGREAVGVPLVEGGCAGDAEATGTKLCDTTEIGIRNDWPRMKDWWSPQTATLFVGRVLNLQRHSS